MKSLNDEASEAISDTLHKATKDELKRIVDRYERLDEEKASLAADQREVMAEAKSRGFDTKAVRACIKARKMDEHQRLEQEAIEHSYRHALGISVQLDMFEERQPASPIAALGAVFEQLVKLGEGGGVNEIHAGPVKLSLQATEDGGVIIRPVSADKVKKAA